VSLASVFEEYFGSSLKDNEILSKAYEIALAVAGQPCLLWKGKRALTVKNDHILKKLFPFIIVRSVTHSPRADMTTDELFNFVAFLRAWDQALPDSRFEIEKMHRTSSKAYLRGYFRFAGLVLQESDFDEPKPYPDYYLMRQIMVVQTNTYTTTITTGLPNHTPETDPYFPSLRGWWDALRIIKAERP
jgi:hypothetical protein